MTKVTLPSLKSLNAQIAGWQKSYVSATTKAHYLLVVTLAHAAQHGDVGPFNRVYDILKTNDKTAAVNYVKRVSAWLGGWDLESIPSAEEMKAYVEAGSFITRGKSGWEILPNATGTTVKAAKENFVANFQMLAEPDGETWKSFLDRNNLTEVKTFGDEEIRVQLARMIQTAKEGRKNVEANVSPDILKALVAAQRIVGEPTAKH